ncbi:aminoglycoside phosphotransferase [Oerskovia turbata]|uniref:Aminoglycoside phosphotransferase n=1 Tax=Oerskovia turbata TaxID=1713 RepID=A0A4V1N549_9CELL|nr:aminoglycoside phosphotransferase [Oerskovia turbata]RXR34426.1 aminoglycoside phosphotransferase [Oerskovia turbata]
MLGLLDAWLPAQRWYPVKGLAVRHVPWMSFALTGRCTLHLLRIVGDGVDLVVQVPLVLTPAGRLAESSETVPPTGPATGAGRAGPAETGGARTPLPGLVGFVPGAPGRPGERLDAPFAVHDGATHPDLWVALLGALERADDVRPSDSDRHDAPGHRPVDLTGARMVGGEQSNSSVILPGVAGGSILKILRTIAIGPNPDVVVPDALARVGWTGVPRPLGWVEATWEPLDVPADAPALGPARTAHLAVLSELVTDARDGFELACAYAAQDTSFADLAADLGRTLASMHRALREALPTGPPLEAGWLLGDLRRRAREACASSVPLGRRAAQVEVFLDGVADRLAREEAPPPVLQAIHGDMHLGQALHALGDGWKILDFEGEPLRPVAERTRPDLPLRDVAGIVRSLDYAAAVGGARSPRWTTTARTAFVEAYRRAIGDDDGTAGLSVSTTEALLRALVLDKALYEVVYESRNRPAWEPIPLTAVDRLLGGR